MAVLSRKDRHKVGQVVGSYLHQTEILNHSNNQKYPISKTLSFPNILDWGLSDVKCYGLQAKK